MFRPLSRRGQARSRCDEVLFGNGNRVRYVCTHCARLKAPSAWYIPMFQDFETLLAGTHYTVPYGTVTYHWTAVTNV
jgi:hypothetical protein